MRDFPATAAPTSEAAADSVNPSEALAIREKVFELIKAAGSTGLTDAEQQTKLNLDGNTQRPRRWELSHKQGRIRQSGTRQTPFGRQASVWVANEIPTLPKENPKPAKQVTVTQKRNGEAIRQFKSFVQEHGNTQVVVFPQTITILSGDQVTIE
jgi:hypothetical protein